MSKFVYISLLSISILLGQVYAYDETELEPCIDGAVSSTGLYPTQALEDQALRDAIQNAANREASAVTVSTN